MFLLSYDPSFTNAHLASEKDINIEVGVNCQAGECAGASDIVIEQEDVRLNFILTLLTPP